MARNDGVDRTTVRNVNLSETKIANTQRHNEREKDSYRNEDIVPERTAYNIHYKTPTGSYSEMFAQMEASKTISTRGLKEDADHYGELIFDVNSVYFHNHGGYEFAKKFYADAYKAAIEIVGGEQYILSAVMHADERNRAMSEALGKSAANKYVLQEKKESKLQKALDAAKKMITDLTEELKTVKAELAQHKSITGKLNRIELEKENAELREKIWWYDSIINAKNLRNLFIRHDHNRQQEHQQKTGGVYEKSTEKNNYQL